MVLGDSWKKIRVPLPSCAVNAIRDAFPEADYEGFHYPQLEM